MGMTETTTDCSTRVTAGQSAYEVIAGKIIRDGTQRGWHATWKSDTGGTWQLSNGTGSALLNLAILSFEQRPVHSDWVVQPERYGFTSPVTSADEILAVACQFIESVPTDLPISLAG